MGIGQVISDTFGMVKERFGALLALWAIFFAITIVLSFVAVIGMAGAGLAGFATLDEADMLAANPLAIGGTMIVLLLLFYLGCAFAYYLVLPAIFTFMTSIAPAGVAVMPDISRFLDFALILFLAFGFCFEVPVALVILVAIGAVTPEQLVRSRPYTIVGAFVIAAILTPPDVISQLLLAIPMCILYEVGIVAARVVSRRSPGDGTADAGPG